MHTTPGRPKHSSSRFHLQHRSVGVEPQRHDVDAYHDSTTSTPSHLILGQKSLDVSQMSQTIQAALQAQHATAKVSPKPIVAQTRITYVPITCEVAG